MRNPTVSGIKYATRSSAPYFFAPETMRFFKQTMRSFHVERTGNEKVFRLYAASAYHLTERYYVDMGLAGSGDDRLEATLDGAVDSLEGGIV